jgi:competence protein ComEA
MRRCPAACPAACLAALLTAPVLAGGKSPPGPVDLNRGTATQLVQLPGVGPGTAKRILAYRGRARGFRSLEELMAVKGIGEKRFLRLKPFLLLGPPPRPPAEEP